MSGIANLIDSNGDPLTKSQISGITSGVTVPNKTYFEDNIHQFISDIVDSVIKEDWSRYWHCSLETSAMAKERVPCFLS